VNDYYYDYFDVRADDVAADIVAIVVDLFGVDGDGQQIIVFVKQCDDHEFYDY